jgi:hypothetical protein
MSASVADLLTAAMSLPDESRTELVEAILERSAPSDAFITDQMATISQRMERVRQGLSTPVPAAEAHHAVLAALRLRV